MFSKRVTVEQVEEGNELAPKFDADGLIPCVTTAAGSGEVLMLGYMNAEALQKTIETGEAHYYSRSRKVKFLAMRVATLGIVAVSTVPFLLVLGRILRWNSRNPRKYLTPSRFMVTLLIQPYSRRKYEAYR
jgi:hypothetical protein